MVKLVWRNLLRNKRRTLLTMSSVALALFILSMLAALLDAMTNVRGSSNAERIVVRNAISLTFSLPEAYWQRLTPLDHVEAVAPMDWFQGVYKDPRPENFFPRFAVDPDTIFSVFTNYRIDPAELAAWKAERTAFVAGRALVERQGWKLGDSITIKGDIYPVDLTLVLRGIFTDPESSSSERQLFFHRRYLEESRGNPGQVGTFWLRLDRPESGTAVIRAVQAMFENSADQVRAETAEAFALSFVQMFGNIRFLFGAIGLAIVVSIFLIVANTMAMAARERTREVAVMRTLGFRRGQVLALVLLEAVVVGVGGALLGSLAARAALAAAGPALQEVGFFFNDLTVSLGGVALALAIGLVLGSLSGLAPALQAARLRIVDGLRRVA